MSKNPEIYVFTPETLQEHNLNIATKVHQATVASTVRQTSRMNAGQLLRSARNNGNDLYWSPKKLQKVLDHIDDCDD